ncbi:type IV pilus assembly protein PilW [Alteromonadaceae bacterium Bs31]|nr:type IV pilus assembly protein PilW [Alteromonadaceae bacterium Bs31]
MSKILNSRPQAGFSLVELLVAMLLGVVLLGGAISVLMGNLQTFRANNGIARVQENARFALEEISRDLRSTSFMGCATGDVRIQNLVSDGSSTDGHLDVVQGLNGFEHGDIDNTVKTELGLAAESAATNLSTTSDLIVIKTLQDVGARLGAPLESGSSNFATGSAADLGAGDILFVSDCKKGALAYVTAVTSSDVTVNLNSKELSSDTTRFEGDSILNKFEVNTYFVAPSSIHSTASSLWRKTNLSAAEELVVGIENIQFLYGENPDPSAETASVQYLEADEVSNMDNVISVRISVTANSIEAVGGQNPITKDFAITVVLRNRNAG